MLVLVLIQYFPELARVEFGVRRLVRMAASVTVAVSSSWNGVVEKSISAPLDKVWDVASDFLSFPNLLTIEAVEGENRVPGCTRKVTNIPGRTDTDSTQWAKQKLVEINADEHVFSYEFLENNTGVEPGYYSTFQVYIPQTHT